MARKFSRMGRPLDEIFEEDVGKPVDYSFRSFKTLQNANLERARETRMMTLPQRGERGERKYLTNAVLLNNKLRNMDGLDMFVQSVIEKPEKMRWLDMSFNYITAIDSSVVKYKNLVILYLHGNKIRGFEEIAKLRPLNKLRTVTFHGNPVTKLRYYRRIVYCLLPTIVNLDFSAITPQERGCPLAPEGLLLLQRVAQEVN